MRWILCAALVVSAFASAKSKAKHPVEKHDAFGSIVLNGEPVEVHWTDGDSFNLKGGQYKGRGTRLQGYNTLEAYGPVHRWGTWTPQELYELAKASAPAAAAKEWTCTTDGKEDGYKRLLINCPDLAVEMVRQGYGMAYFVDGTKPDPKVLEAQRDAQKAGRGMWAKGVVNGVVSSLHSVGEDGDDERDSAYNRVVDTRTGEAGKRKHANRYETCQEVCEDTDGNQSCMVYVPFKRRYRNQPPCLLGQ